MDGFQEEGQVQQVSEVPPPGLTEMPPPPEPIAAPSPVAAETLPPSEPAKHTEPPTEPVKIYDGRAEVAHLTAEYTTAAARMRLLLHEIEWSGPEVQLPTHRKVGTCPSCHSHLTHLAGCRLKAELG
jgi:hypothetical protein